MEPAVRLARLVDLHLGGHRHHHRRRRVRRRVRRRADRHRGHARRSSWPPRSALLVVAFAANYSGTRTLARIARIGLAAELVGVIALGLYLLLFQREQPFSIFFDPLGAGGGDGYAGAFLAASLSGLFLFYGFEACGDVAEEVADPARQIPRAMILTDPRRRRLRASCPTPGTCSPRPTCRRSSPARTPTRSRRSSRARSAQRVPRSSSSSSSPRSCPACCRCRPPAAGCSTPSPATGCCPPAAGWRTCRPRHAVPTNALLVVCVVPVLIALFVFFQEGDRSPASRRSRCSASTSRSRPSCWPRCGSGSGAGARPGCGTSGPPGFVVNVLALAYGVFAIVLLIKPAPGTETFLDRWIVAIGLAVVAGSGLLYLLVARPDRHSVARPRGRRPRGRPAAPRPSAETGTSPPRRRSDEVQLRDAARLLARGVPGGHPPGRRAGLLRRLRGRRDLAQGPVAAVRRGRRADEADPDGPQRLRGDPARAHASSPRPPRPSTS